jgi:hypothetical protein
MAAVLNEVRKKVEETVGRLMQEIPAIRIGIIAHGDYCDNNTMDILDLSQDKEKICAFVRSVASN